MMGVMKKSLIIALVLLAYLVVIAPRSFVPGPALTNLCGNEPVAAYPSPDGAAKVVVFQRDCGATTGFSTQASLIQGSEDLPNEGGNLFVADTDHGAAPAAHWGGPSLVVRWDGPRRLVLKHHPDARVFKAEKDLDGVAVKYAYVR
jgi:hypothetical protein